MEYDKFISNSFNRSNGRSYSIDILNGAAYSLKSIRLKDLIIAPMLDFDSKFQLLTSMSDMTETLSPVNVSSTNERPSYRGPVTFLRGIPKYSTLKKASLKETEYLTGQGIICLGDLTPLMIAYVVCVKSGALYTVKKVVVFINSSIYDKTDAISKNMRSVALKGLSQCTVTLYNNTYNHLNQRMLDWGHNGYDNGLSVPVEVVLTRDFSGILVRPSVPDITFNEDNVNKFLADNADKIMERWK